MENWQLSLVPDVISTGFTDEEAQFLFEVATFQTKSFKLRLFELDNDYHDNPNERNKLNSSIKIWSSIASKLEDHIKRRVN